MFERIRRNISHPKYAFLYIKDKLSRVFFYIIILTALMSLPTILISIINPAKMIPSNEEVSLALQKVYNDDLKIEDNKLIRPENYSRTIKIDTFNIAFGNFDDNQVGYFIVFEKNEIVTYLVAGSGLSIVSHEYSYESLNINNLEINNQNDKRITSLIINVFSNDNTIVISLVLSAIMINFADLMFLIIFLTVIANFIQRLPIKFSDHFKINTYISTIYAITTLILQLFGLSSLHLLTLIITAFYQLKAYRSIQIVKKIEVRKKDE